MGLTCSRLMLYSDTRVIIYIERRLTSTLSAASRCKEATYFPDNASVGIQ